MILRLFLAFIAFTFMMSCSSKPKLDIQGHRGCRGLLPENSLPAFKKAIDLGVTTLELDVVISKDQKVVVSHEAYMNRTICYDTTGAEIVNDKAFNLYHMTYDEIKAFDCGSKKYPRFPEQKNRKTYKPLLSEVIELSDSLNPEIRYNIEIKTGPADYNVFTPEPEEFVRLVMEVINSYPIAQRSNLQSFDVNVLNEIKKQAPEMELALLVDGSENINEKLKELNFKPEIISPAFELLTPENVKEYQKDGYKVIPWTVNRLKDMEAMLAMKVDGIITDYPDVLISLSTVY